MAVGIIDGGGNGNKVGVNSINRLLTDNFPSSDFFSNVALGLVEGASIQPVTGTISVGEGVANEQVIGDGQTTRYPFPSVAAQMTLVSDSTSDDSAGTGARIIFIRGNITGNVELFEIISIDGTTPITTVNSYFRVNSIAVISAGSGQKNAGNITLKNGSDLLAQINIGKSVSRTCVHSAPAGTISLISGVTSYAGKDDNATVVTHSFEQVISRIDFTGFEQQTYVDQINLTFLPFAVVPGADLEITAFSEVGTGNSIISVSFDVLTIED